MPPDGHGLDAVFRSTRKDGYKGRGKHVRTSIVWWLNC
jgi:hypothetical protein